MDTVSFWANLGTLAALVLTAVVLVVTARQLWTGRRAASASALISLNESLRQAWWQFSTAADAKAKQHTFSDVMNLLEIACAAYRDRLFLGKTGELLEHYLCDVLNLIGESDYARASILKMFSKTRDLLQHLSFFRKAQKTNHWLASTSTTAKLTGYARPGP